MTIDILSSPFEISLGRQLLLPTIFIYSFDSFRAVVLSTWYFNDACATHDQF